MRGCWSPKRAATGWCRRAPVARLSGRNRLPGLDRKRPRKSILPKPARMVYIRCSVRWPLGPCPAPGRASRSPAIRPDGYGAGCSSTTRPQFSGARTFSRSATPSSGACSPLPASARAIVPGSVIYNAGDVPEGAHRPGQRHRRHLSAAATTPTRIVISNAGRGAGRDVADRRQAAPGDGQGGRPGRDPVRAAHGVHEAVRAGARPRRTRRRPHPRGSARAISAPSKR